MTYRFVGTKMNIGDIELVKVGQPIQLDAVDWRWPLVTEKQFEDAAFDAADLDKFGHHAARHMAPPEFIVKLSALWKLLPSAPPKVENMDGTTEPVEARKKGGK